MEVCEEFVKQMRTRVIKRMKAWLSQEEFDVQVAENIRLGRFTAEEVAEALEGFDMETDMTSPAERALALVGEHGELTSGQLHAMLKLDVDECPSEALAEALEDGLLIKEGKYWTLPTERDKRQDTHYMPTPAQVAAFPRPILAAKRDVRTHEEKAIEYLREQPDHRCSNKQMVEVIGILNTNTSLNRALERQTLARDGTDWILGPNRRTNVEAAVEYLKSHPERRATNAEMYQVLGFKGGLRKAALEVSLRSGLQSGRLRRDGQTWILGEFAEAA